MLQKIIPSSEAEKQSEPKAAAGTECRRFANHIIREENHAKSTFDQGRVVGA